MLLACSYWNRLLECYWKSLLRIPRDDCISQKKKLKVSNILWTDHNLKIQLRYPPHPPEKNKKKEGRGEFSVQEAQQGTRQRWYSRLCSRRGELTVVYKQSTDTEKFNWSNAVESSRAEGESASTAINIYIFNPLQICTLFPPINPQFSTSFSDCLWSPFVTIKLGLPLDGYWADRHNQAKEWEKEGLMVTSSK